MTLKLLSSNKTSIKVAIISANYFIRTSFKKEQAPRDAKKDKAVVAIVQCQYELNQFLQQQELILSAQTKLSFNKS